MKNQTKKVVAVQGTKATQTKEVVLSGKKAPKKNTSKKNILDTDYGRQVLAVNTDLKKATKTIGGARAILLNLHTEGMLKLQPYQVAILKASKKSQAVYETLKSVTFHHKKSGNPSPFYVLQAIYNTKKRAKIEKIISLNK